MSNPPITIRLPTRYTTSHQPPTGTTTPFTPPPLPFLHRTWTVTHSTLRMWRSARNVRITYGPLPPSTTTSSSSSSTSKGNNTEEGSRERLSDLVEYESLSGAGRVKRVAGVDTASSAGDTGIWDWRGSGWLFFVGSHWEVLGWGERAVTAAGTGTGTGTGGEEGGEEGELERWVVTWFAPTVFTAEGVDVYSDRPGGASEALVREVLAELDRVTKGVGKLGEMVERDMREVKVQLPWKQA